MKASLIFLAALAAIVFALTLAPWKEWAEHKLKTELASRGLSDIAFYVESLGIDGITLKDVSSSRFPLTLNTLTVDYSIFDLLKGELRALHVNTLQWKRGQMRVVANDAAVRFIPAKIPGGEWEIRLITVETPSFPVAPLAGGGMWEMKDEAFFARGRLKSADEKTHCAFTLQYSKNNPAASRLVITEAALPWNGGMLTTQNAVISLAKGESRFLLELKSVSLNALLQTLTGERATATGLVSGAIPIVIDPNGAIAVEPGSLKADRAGTIALSPETIPGDNEQVSLARDILKNFHYDELSMTLSKNEDEKLSMLLSLSGNNPDVYNGKPVNLNVKLTGDVLSLVEQSLMPMADPKQFLEQSQ